MAMRGRRTLAAESGEGRHRVWAEVVRAGEDLVIYMGGGERPHIGSISLSSAEGAPISASLPGHKDYVVSNRAAERVSRETGRACVVVAGLHVDGAERPDIDLLLANAERCLDTLIRLLKK